MSKKKLDYGKRNDRKIMKSNHDKMNYKTEKRPVPKFALEHVLNDIYPDGIRKQEEKP